MSSAAHDLNLVGDPMYALYPGNQKKKNLASIQSGQHLNLHSACRNGPRLMLICVSNTLQNWDLLGAFMIIAPVQSGQQMSTKDICFYVHKHMLTNHLWCLDSSKMQIGVCWIHQK